jgi:hypothetical protein
VACPVGVQPPDQASAPPCRRTRRHRRP